MGKKAVPFFFSSLGIYIVLALIEIFLLKPLFDMAGAGLWANIAVYGILLIIVNSWIDYFILKRLPFGMDEQKTPNPLDDDL